MGIADYVLLFIILLGVLYSIIVIIKQRKSGKGIGCAGCSGCCSSCSKKYNS